MADNESRAPELERRKLRREATQRPELEFRRPRLFSVDLCCTPAASAARSDARCRSPQLDGVRPVPSSTFRPMPPLLVRL